MTFSEYLTNLNQLFGNVYEISIGIKKTPNQIKDLYNSLLYIRNSMLLEEVLLHDTPGGKIIGNRIELLCKKVEQWESMIYTDSDVEYGEFNNLQNGNQIDLIMEQYEDEKQELKDSIRTIIYQIPFISESIFSLIRLNTQYYKEEYVADDSSVQTLKIDVNYTEYKNSTDNKKEDIPPVESDVKSNKRGRRQKEFMDFISNEYKENSDYIIKRLHALLDNSRGSDAALKLFSMIEYGYIMDSVERSAFVREFPSCSIDNNIWTSHVKGNHFFRGYDGRIKDIQKTFMEQLTLNNIETN